MLMEKGRMGCKNIVKLAIPSVRFALSNLLHKKYGMDQTEISKLLSITQAAVNKYINRKCAKGIAAAGDRIMRSGVADGAAREIVNIAAKKARATGRINEVVDGLAIGKAVSDLL